MAAADLCAAGVGAPHLRQRLFFVAESEGGEPERRVGDGDAGRNSRPPDGCELGVAAGNGRPLDLRGPGAGAEPEPASAGVVRRVALAAEPGRRAWERAAGASAGGDSEEPGRLRAAGRLAVPTGPGLQERAGERGDGEKELAAPVGGCGVGFWRELDWLPCRDPAGVKWRPAERGLFPLASGVSFRLADGRSRQDCSRAALLKGIGNSIVPQAAAVFVRAYMEARGNR